MKKKKKKIVIPVQCGGVAAVIVKAVVIAVMVPEGDGSSSGLRGVVTDLGRRHRRQRLAVSSVASM